MYRGVDALLGTSVQSSLFCVVSHQGFYTNRTAVSGQSRPAGYDGTLVYSFGQSSCSKSCHHLPTEKGRPCLRYWATLLVSLALTSGIAQIP
jgi:hypothetical protein